MAFGKWALDPLRAEDTPDSAFLHNLAAADAARDLPLLLAVFQSWQDTHPTGTLQDFEKLLRAQNLETHLIAASDEPAPGAVCIQSWAKNKPAVHNAVFSVRPRELALKELLGKWPSYDANFAALANCGLFTFQKSVNEEILEATRKHAADVGGTVVATNAAPEQAFIEQIRAGRARVRRLTPKEIIDKINEDLTQHFGTAPEHTLVSLARDGRPVMGLKCGAHGLYPVGYAIDGRGNMSLVNFENEP